MILTVVHTETITQFNVPIGKGKHAG